ncbi:hypothetical protein ABNF97_06490 [Plantactinospora sp. B6F1]|uniref:hypothetical protein n=1 Tax=Plantactinospora sp. B6F1 TaxID=3158971 RepID=UPI0032D906C2
MQFETRPTTAAQQKRSPGRGGQRQLAVTLATLGLALLGPVAAPVPAHAGPGQVAEPGMGTLRTLAYPVPAGALFVSPTGSDGAPGTESEPRDPDTWYRVTLTHTVTTDDNLLPLSVLSHNLTPGGPTLLVDDCTLTG